MAEFAPSRTLTDVRLAFLAGFEYDAAVNGQSAELSAALEWDHPGAEHRPLQEFRTPEEFLVQKQIFTEGRAPIPSWPPIRGRAREKLQMEFQLPAGPLPLDFTVYASCFREQGLITLLAVADVEEVTLDRLLFVKQGKWYRCEDAAGASWLAVNAGGAPGGAESYSECFRRFLERQLAVGVAPNRWPIFDFIELSHVGPSVGGGPNSDSRLQVQEHWGLLVGDEGYRLLDSNEATYSVLLNDPAWRFRGRRDWLYNFSTTSCLAFVDPDIKAHRTDWRTYYSGTVGKVDILDRYLAFSPSIPTLQDGIPLLVEICLLRYAELRRISDLLKKDEGEGLQRVWKWTWARVQGRTPLERAVMKLEHLDLYQETALWIIGGAYTDRLFEYESIRKRLDKSIDDAKAIGADVRVFYLGLISIVVAVVAVVLSVVKP